MLLLLALAAVPLNALGQDASAPGLTLRLSDVSPEQLAQSLTRALGVEVVVEAAPHRRFALELADVPPEQLLERTAEALRGHWVPIYRLEPGLESAQGARTGPRISTGRTVTLRLLGVPARAALASVARAAGGAAEVAPEIAGMVSLSVEGLPVEEALDRLAAQVHAHWRVRYRLVPGEVPTAAPGPASIPAPVHREMPRPVPLTPPRGSGIRARTPANRVPRTGVLRQLLTQDLARLLATGPKMRRPAVQRYTRRLKEAFRAMGALNPDERARRFEALRPYFESGLRAFNGLTPAQRHEFQPVAELLRRWMP